MEEMALSESQETSMDKSQGAQSFAEKRLASTH